MLCSLYTESFDWPTDRESNRFWVDWSVVTTIVSRMFDFHSTVARIANSRRLCLHQDLANGYHVHRRSIASACAQQTCRTSVEDTKPPAQRSCDRQTSQRSIDRPLSERLSLLAILFQSSKNSFQRSSKYCPFALISASILRISTGANP